MKKRKDKKILFNWTEKNSDKRRERVGAMYCFSRCEVNQN